MIEEAHVYECKRLFEAHCQYFIKSRWLDISRQAIVSENYRRGIVGQRPFGDLTGILRVGGECTVKQDFEGENAVMVIQENGAEHLVIVTGKLVHQVFARHARRLQTSFRGTARGENFARLIQDIIGGNQRCRPIETGLILKRTKGSGRHFRGGVMCWVSGLASWRRLFS